MSKKNSIYLEVIAAIRAFTCAIVPLNPDRLRDDRDERRRLAKEYPDTEA